MVGVNNINRECYHFNAKRTKDELVKFIRDWFDKNGKNCNAIIGISGGKDSSIMAALCVEAIGKERVIGVMMPNGVQNDIETSYDLVNYLGIKYIVCNVADIAKQCLLPLTLNCENSICEYNPVVWSDKTKINLLPRIRMTMLYAIAQSLNGRVTCNSNLSEKIIGYYTRWGDGVGDLAPFADLTSEEVVAVGEALGLPNQFTHKAPADGLTGKTDEEVFGFSYSDLNDYLFYQNNFFANREKQNPVDVETANKIDKLIAKNHFKDTMNVFHPSFECFKE